MPTTPSELGLLLRQMRLKRNLSQVEAARLTGVGRVTLNRWESGVQQPRGVESEALLVALGATVTERRRFGSLYQTAGTRARARDLLDEVGHQKGIGPLPQSGDLLRALRLRRKLSQSEAAALVGVTSRTMRRWEQSEIWPAPPQLDALCDALGARFEERAALLAGDFAPRVHSENCSLEELSHRASILHRSWQSGQQALKELEYLLLESQAWPLAARSAGGREVLSQIYGCHAHYLDYHGRLSESGRYAERSLDAAIGARFLSDAQSLSVIAAARAAAYRGGQPMAIRGIEMLTPWLDAPQPLDYKAWLLSDLAKYTAQAGDAESGLMLAQRAVDISRLTANPVEPVYRALDQAQILVWSGRASQALSVLEQEEGPCTYLPLQASLLEVEIYLQLNNPTIAHDRLQSAMMLIEELAMPSLLPKAQKLALRF